MKSVILAAMLVVSSFAIAEGEAAAPAAAPAAAMTSKMTAKQAKAECKKQAKAEGKKLNHKALMACVSSKTQSN